jgi:hypothetical protein
VNPKLIVCVVPLEYTVALSLPTSSGASISTELSKWLDAKDIQGRIADELFKDKKISIPS